ncbi:MAG: Uncharacterised protein [SAR116 cluster bacterium]|nr:MAG: Uncharacterised protein [SAR116 cluster bacterium]
MIISYDKLSLAIRTVSDTFSVRPLGSELAFPVLSWLQLKEKPNIATENRKQTNFKQLIFM